MCGIIGLKSKDTALLRQSLISLLLESEIRGKHATGITYVKDSELVTIKADVPPTEFIGYLPPDLGNVVIGHVRYSTSALGHNQPLTLGRTSLVHNGVITQAPFEQWGELYGIEHFATKNDSEILLNYIIAVEDCFNFKNSSIACGYIKNGELYCYRNNTRPLWLFGTPDIKGFVSTHNIMRRALPDLNLVHTNATAGELYQITYDNFKTIHKVNLNDPDLQQPSNRAVSYLAEGRICY